MDKLNHSEHILRTLHIFGSLRTSQILQKLWENKVSIGVGSVDRRLRDLQEAGKIIGFEKDGEREKSWRIENGELF